MHGAGEDVAPSCQIPSNGQTDNRHHAVRARGRLRRVGQARRRRSRRAAELRRSRTRSSTIVDGLLLTGGLDVDPALYGEAAHATTADRAGPRSVRDPAVEGRDRARPAVFAICRGVQVLNVAAGGSLVQDIPSARHDRPEPLDRHSEGSPRAPGTASRRARASPRRWGPRPISTTCAVNSRHHQSVARVAPRSSCRRCRRTASWKRSSGPTRRSASACSGIRRTSGRPESSRACSRRSWRRRRRVDGRRQARSSQEQTKSRCLVHS